MLSHYRPSRPRPRYAIVIGRYDLPLRRAMLARQTSPPAYVDPFGRVYHGLRRFRARNHRPGREQADSSMRATRGRCAARTVRPARRRRDLWTAPPR